VPWGKSAHPGRGAGLPGVMGDRSSSVLLEETPAVAVAPVEVRPAARKGVDSSTVGPPGRRLLGEETPRGLGRDRRRGPPLVESRHRGTVPSAMQLPKSSTLPGREMSMITTM